MRLIRILAILAVCSSLAQAQERAAAVIATDYTAVGYLTGMDLAAPWSVGPLPGEPVHHDAVARWHDGLVWVVNRAGADNVQVLDPDANFDTVRQFSLGLGRNIQDIDFAADGTAYVSCYDTAELLHLDPRTGQILQVISTAAFSDADGLPETSALLRHENRLYVACQRLDRDGWYAPVGDSYVLVLDTDDNTWIDCDGDQPGTQGILLAATNPSSPLFVTDDHLLVGCNGYYGVQDGGVDVIDPVALVSLGLEVTEAALGGDLVDLEPTGDSRHAIVAGPSWVTDVKRYRPGSGPTAVLSGVAYDFADLAWDGDFQLFIADRRTSNPGLRVLDTISGTELTGGTIDTGLPPAIVVIPAADPVGVADAPSLALSLSPPWPNPANPSTRFEFTAPSGGIARLRLVDLRGRSVRQVEVPIDGDGRGTWAFDGCDDQGRVVASGVYRCVVQTPAGFAARSVTIVR